MAEPLSPAAQAVLDAAICVPIPGDSVWGVIHLEVAAALRAAADQVVPLDRRSRRQCNIRRAILAIATELEGNNG